MSLIFLIFYRTFCCEFLFSLYFTFSSVLLLEWCKSMIQLWFEQIRSFLFVLVGKSISLFSLLFLVYKVVLSIFCESLWTRHSPNKHFDCNAKGEESNRCCANSVNFTIPSTSSPLFCSSCYPFCWVLLCFCVRECVSWGVCLRLLKVLHHL